MTTVRTGEKGVDFSFARPPAARLLELGYTFIVGYISVPPSAPDKNITARECQTYLEAGLKLLLVWEMSATRASLGPTYGLVDGRDAKEQATRRGYPTDVPILVADDTNTTTTNITAQSAYMRAFAGACAPYPIGIYGDTDILGVTIDVWKIGWLPNAWAWSGTSRAQAEAKALSIGAHVLQHKGFYIDNIWAVDPNEAIRDFPAWGLTPDPLPPLIGDDMPAFISNKFAGKYGAAPSPQGGCTIWERVLGTKRHLGFEDWVGYGMPFGVACDDATLDGIPDYAPGQSGAVFPQQMRGDGVLNLHDETFTLAGTVG